VHLTPKKEALTVFVIGLLLAVIWTWPLAPSLGSSLPHDTRFTPAAASDMHIWVWDFWWVAEAVAGQGELFFSDQINLPQGQSLALHTHVFLWGLLTLPLQWLGGPVFAVGCALLLLFASAFAATWVLLRGIGIGRVGAGFGAFAWAFSPYFLQKGLEHMDFGATPWPPLFLLFLLHWLHSDEGKGLRYALGVGIVFGLTLLTSPLGALSTLMLGVLVVAIFPSMPSLGPSRGGRSRIFNGPCLMASTFVAAGIGLPWLLELGQELWRVAEFEAIYPAFRGAIHRETTAFAQLADFVRLPGLHPLAQAFAEPGQTPGLPPGAPPGWNELSGLHLSITLIPLAIFAIRGRRHLASWATLAGVLFLLTWDPTFGPGSGILSELIRGIPGLETLRVPPRLFPYFLLPCVLLAAVGVDRLAGYSRGLVGLAFAVLVCESLVVSYPLMEVSAPDAVSQLAAEEGDLGVLTLPIRFGASEAMTWQTVHGMPVAFSYVARPNPKSLFLWSKTTDDLYALAIPRFSPLGELRFPTSEGLEMDLTHIDVGHVLVDTEALAPAPLVLSNLLDLLDTMPGWERRATSDSVQWWTRIL
jgi:hypothetical protein